MQKAAEDLKKKQAEELEAKKKIIQSRVPALQVEGLNQGGLHAHPIRMQSAYSQHATTSIFRHVCVVCTASLTAIYVEQFMFPPGFINIHVSPACKSVSHAVSMQSTHTSIHQHVGVAFMATLTMIYAEQFMLSWRISSAC